jgi:hypothetical protein
MKVAYVFITPRAATYKLGQMILPQLEAGTHGVEVVGMFFFDDNAFVLRQGDPIGERLAKLAKEKGILLMMCDACALERNLAKGELRWCNPRRHRAHDARRGRALQHCRGRAGGLLPRPVCRAGRQPA